MIIIISRCYVKANSFVQLLCPKFALTYVELALTSSRYSYGINPIVGIRLNVEYMLVIIIIIIIMTMIMIIYKNVSTTDLVTYEVLKVLGKSV